ncbi:MAG: thermonuclease family protein [Alphaproteobacteria bacterium]
MKKISLFVMSLIILATATASAAQEAPAPRKMPRTPVNRQSLPGSKPALPPSSVVQGQASVIDSERLRINDVDMRLFGVVPPQLSATHGPQAREALDQMVAGKTVSCTVRDRDQGGRYLATCRAGNNDIAYELLRRGLAVTARGSLSNSDLAISYLAAEQAAQAQKSGIWSGAVPSAVTVSAVPPKVEAPKAEALVVPPPPTPLVIEAKKEEKSAKTLAAADDAQAKAPSNAVIPASALAPTADEAMALPVAGPNFFARYQLLITGFIMLVTALSILFVVSRQRRQEKLDEMKAIAAALRGELMAARAVCQARFKSITTVEDDKAATWPRIRSTLYQAYVGRLGWLGAELARQIASIYGQASDYAAYYNDDATRAEVAPKRQALMTLIQYIEEVLPKLAVIEQTGKVQNTLSTSVRPVTVIERSAPLAAAASTVATSAAVLAKEEVVEAEPEISAPVQTPIWETVRKFARERFEAKNEAMEEQMPDYTTLIEEEMANMTFGDAGDDETLPENVTKFNKTGS